MRYLILFLIILSLPIVLSLGNETSITSAGNNESFLSSFGNAEVSGFVIGQGVNETQVDDNGGSEPVTQTSTGGNDDSSPEPECTPQDASACSLDEKCLSGKCVKLFDVKILEFESPVALGDFFDFIYLMKGMAEINNDVTIDFWIENSQGIKVTSGSDVIYLGSFEEKREAARIFLPEDTVSGTYRFFVSVTFEDYSASSFRTIEINVKDGIAEIKDAQNKIPIPFIVIIILAILFALKKDHLDKIKTQKAHELYHGRLFSPHAKPRGKSVTLYHLAKSIEQTAEMEKPEEKPEAKPEKEKKIVGQIDTKEELDEMLDRLEKKEKDPKEKPF